MKALRETLILTLLKEQPEYGNMVIPSDDKEQERLLRALMNVRPPKPADEAFVKDEGWHQAASRYEEFIHKNENRRVLYLELGVGSNTPGIIKFPFGKMAMANPRATYACINLGEAVCPKQLEKQAICIDGDISQVLHDVKRR